MFIGHFGIGFAAKKWTPGISLAVLFIAAQFIDLLWPIFLLLGIEHVAISPGITRLTPLDFTDYPFTHSLLAALAWGCVVGIAGRIVTRSSKVALILALCVISHWLLDLLVHRPDLPLTPGDSPKAGFGLWNFPVVTFVLEGLFYAGGVVLYVRSTAPKNRKGRVGLIVLVVLLVVIYLANILGGPPPSVAAIGWGAQFLWLLVLLAYWVDANRSPLRSA